jgi:hypothetical protein
MTFTQYGVTAFQAQYWDGAGWVDVPGGNVTGNNLVWKQLTFAPVSTDRIRVLVNAALAGYARIVEVEAWTASGAPVNASPTVVLTAPAVGATYTAPAGITLSATATDSDGTISRVEFYQGVTLVGTVTAPTTVGGTQYSYNWSNVVAGNYTLSAKAYDNQNAVGSSTAVNVTVNAAGVTVVNVALAGNGAVATASSAYNYLYPVDAINDGDRKGLNWGNGGGWNDATSGTYPDWVQINFSGVKTIGEVDVFTVQDNYASPVVPTAGMTFTQYGVTAFQAQYWDGAGWVDLPGGNVTGNNLVWKQLTFAPVSTDRIRVLVNGALAGYSRIVEVEAWTAP